VRGCKYPLVIGDMPFGSYEISPEQALASAYRMVKEGGVDCIKMEGGKVRAPAVKKLVEGGIAVMAHIGLNPQHISVVGGFKAQGRTAKKAMSVLDDALALQEAGAFAIFLECVPAEVTRMSLSGSRYLLLVLAPVPIQQDNALSTTTSWDSVNIRTSPV